jgi:hypothetical protein
MAYCDIAYSEQAVGFICAVKCIEISREDGPKRRKFHVNGINNTRNWELSDFIQFLSRLRD